MGKVKGRSIKRSMAITFLLTICMIAAFSGITIFLASRLQQEILRNRYLTIKSANFKENKTIYGYVLEADENNIEWHELSAGETVGYYGCYIAMVALPVLYIVVGIGSAAAIYYRRKLRVPILQLQNGMQRIQDNDLDFDIGYRGEDELGQLCSSMEKMQKELRHKNKALWETLQQRKLLNASVAHDLRTPIAVLRGYLDYLQRNIPQDKLTEGMLMDTLSSMQGAVLRLEHYAECVRDVEKMESIEIKCEPQDTASLLKEIESNIGQLEDAGNIMFRTDISLPRVNIDKSALFRILENLLQNALRYRKQQVVVELAQKDKLFLLSVQDDGRGFSEEALRQASNMFYGTEKGKEHFGIGLGVCKLLCEKHGGFLQIKNKEEGGACVTAALDIFS